VLVPGRKSSDNRMCRDGCENAFLLHVSLHPVSRKMLIQLMEAHAQGNVRSLGLLPGNYVADGAEALQRRSWAGAARFGRRHAVSSKSFDAFHRVLADR